MSTTAHRPRTRPVPADDRALAAQALPLMSGRLATLGAWHEFVPLTAGVQTQCAACWGWRDDPRHPVVGGPVVGR